MMIASDLPADVQEDLAVLIQTYAEQNSLPVIR